MYNSKFVTFHLLEDHQCWVNLWNIGMWKHATYTYEQALIIRLYLSFKLSIIFILSFIHIVQYNLPQVLIESIRFIVHSCGLGSCVKCLATWSVKESDFYLSWIFGPRLWSVVELFLEYYGYLQCTSHHSIYM